jgi:shikimate kinase
VSDTERVTDTVKRLTVSDTASECLTPRVASVANLVLTGFMGTGKTTVGRLLAERLGFDFVDSDALIVDRHGSVAQIFAEHGEHEFRRIEGEVAAELASRDRIVIATGGRMLLDPANAEALARTGRIVCLTASVDTILRRVAPDGTAANRPLLAGHDVRQRVEQLLAERQSGYAAFEQVSTDDRSPSEICDEIIRHVR